MDQTVWLGPFGVEVFVITIIIIRTSHHHRR